MTRRAGCFRTQPRSPVLLSAFDEEDLDDVGGNAVGNQSGTNRALSTRSATRTSTPSFWTIDQLSAVSSLQAAKESLAELRQVYLPQPVLLGEQPQALTSDLALAAVEARLQNRCGE